MKAGSPLQGTQPQLWLEVMPVLTPVPRGREPLRPRQELRTKTWSSSAPALITGKNHACNRTGPRLTAHLGGHPQSSVLAPTPLGHPLLPTLLTLQATTPPPPRPQPLAGLCLLELLRDGSDLLHTVLVGGQVTLKGLMFLEQGLDL